LLQKHFFKKVSSKVPKNHDIFSSDCLLSFISSILDWSSPYSSEGNSFSLDSDFFNAGITISSYYVIFLYSCGFLEK